MPGPAALPEPCTAPGAGRHGGMPRGASESPSPQSWGQKQRFNSKIGVSQRNHPQASPPVNPKGGCSAPEQGAQSQPSQTAGVFWLELAQLCPPFHLGLGGCGTLVEVGADVGHLVAVCCHAGSGVAIAEAAGAAGRVVGLQVKPAWLAPGHGEETGAQGMGQAEPWGTTAASQGGHRWQL